MDSHFLSSPTLDYYTMFKKVFIKHLFEESKMKMPSLQGRGFHVVMAMISIISAFEVFILGKETKNRVNSI